MKPAPAVSPLSPEHLLEYASAQQRQKKVRRAVSVAATDAWLTALFAAITLISGLFSLPALLLGLAMSGVAFNSFRGARMIKRTDPRGASLLGLNQLLLAISITAYAAWCLYSSKPADQLPDLDAGDAASVMNSFGPLIQSIMAFVYGAVIACTWLFQGGTAWYYFSRRKHIEAYLTSTPQWIHDLQRVQQP